MSEPCPVCGAADGNCPNEADHVANLKTIEWAEDVAEPPTVAVAGVIASERIWEEVPIWNAQRTRRVLRYRAGQVVSREDAERLHVGDDGRQFAPARATEERPMVEIEGPAGPNLEGPVAGPEETPSIPLDS